ncbi:MAG: hypothetical protein A2283_08240 [Lentisphaerae bacterium RIFOXYA12_FULL_48_11]|nr:MAG: hypothetical protein A2283_08240 [Lentisphaerae bacterium RIFOXYA12_FULL_48_11]
MNEFAGICNRYIAVGLVIMSGVSNVLADNGTDSVSGSNTGLGYLTAPSMAPGHILLPSSVFVLPAFCARGSSRIDFDVHWANVWNYDPDQYLIDSEWIRSNVRLTYALKDTISAGIAVPIIGRIGGFSDSAIENFHSAFGLGNSHRDEFPRNQSIISVRDNDESRTIVEGNSWGIGDISFFVASCISGGDRILPSLSVQGQVSLPSGNEDELRGIGSSTVGLSAVASKRISKAPLFLFGGVGLQYCIQNNMSSVELQREIWSGLLGVEYQCTPSISLVTQYLGSSRAAEDFFAFSDPCHEVSAGFKWLVTSHTILEFAIVENLFEYENSADIGIHLSFGRNL